MHTRKEYGRNSMILIYLIYTQVKEHKIVKLDVNIINK